MQVLWLANLFCINYPVDPDFVQILVIFQQPLEVHRIDQSPFTIGVAVDLYGSLDERQS